MQLDKEYCISYNIIRDSCSSFNIDLPMFTAPNNNKAHIITGRILAWLKVEKV